MDAGNAKRGTDLREDLLEHGGIDEPRRIVRLVRDHHHLETSLTKAGHRGTVIRIELEMLKAPNRVPLAIAYVGYDKDPITVEIHDPTAAGHLAARLSQCADETASLG